MGLEIPNPTFRWEIRQEVLGGETVKSSELFVSVFPRGEGLVARDYPKGWDSVVQLLQKTVGLGSDVHPGRIVTVTLGPNARVQYALPSTIKLTAGQTYYWAVRATTSGGRVAVATASFETGPIQLGKPYNGVTILTHGLELDAGGAVPAWTGELARWILEVSGGGTVLKYDTQKGTWVRNTPQTGKAVVLIPNWAADSRIIDTGFAEAAADALFAGLVGLDNTLGQNLLKSPLHFIGHGRGAAVNTEIVQRLGVYFPDAKDVHFTTLDPPALGQASLAVPLADIHSALKQVTLADAQATLKSILQSVLEIKKALMSSRLNPTQHVLRPGNPVVDERGVRGQLLSDAGFGDLNADSERARHSRGRSQRQTRWQDRFHPGRSADAKVRVRRGRSA